MDKMYENLGEIALCALMYENLRKIALSPLVNAVGPTSQNSEKDKEMIVNLWMSWMPILDLKKENTPKNAQTTN